MKKLLIIILSAIAVTGVFSAERTDSKKIKPEKPDMERIKRDVNTPTSKYYYPNLMKMYNTNDTIMNLDQFRHLYLGYVFQEDYNPYRRSQYSSRVEELYYKDKHTQAECDTIIKYAELSLKDDPFDLRQISFLIYAYREKKKFNLASIWQYKLNHLLEAILSTGTGLDQENAWIVINPQHEYNLVNFQNCVVESQEDRPPHYDYILVKQNDEKKESKGFYFNVLYVLQEYYRKYPDELNQTE